MRGGWGGVGVGVGEPWIWGKFVNGEGFFKAFDGFFELVFKKVVAS